MIDQLLSINMMMTAFVNQLLTMGLPVIDESLAELMSVMKSAPTNGLFGEMQSMARGLGITLALCVGSYECWVMILGRRAMDVLKILRILGLAICIQFSPLICSALDVPGNWLESRTQGMAKAANKQVATLERAVATKQQEYMDSLRSQMSKQEEQKAAQDAATEDGIWDKIQHGVENIGISIQNFAKQAAVLLETKISEWANDIIRFIGEIIFQMTYYGMLVGQRIFLSVLKLFCPVMFALSIVPPWRSAWSQWISKYLTISLWGFLVYLIVYYIDFLIMYYLKSDLTAYNQLLHNAAGWNNIGALGMQAIGTTCMYVLGSFLEVFLLVLVLWLPVHQVELLVLLVQQSVSLLELQQVVQVLLQVLLEPITKAVQVAVLLLVLLSIVQLVIQVLVRVSYQDQNEQKNLIIVERKNRIVDY